VMARLLYNPQALVAFAALCVIFASCMLLTAPTEATENPSLATHRTHWSSPNHTQRLAWHRWHDTLVAEAGSYQPSALGLSRVALIGDSIIEHVRGSSYGRPKSTAASNPPVLASTIGQRWPDPLVFGVSGDQTQHVLWRVSHGELSSTMATDPKLLMALLIGTNNLAGGHQPDETANGVVAVAHWLLSHSRGRLLILGLLPRADGSKLLPRLCPPRCNGRGEPFRSFGPAIMRVNSKLRSSTAKLAVRFPRRVAFLDCGAVVGGGGGSHAEGEAGDEAGAEVNLTLMPDRLHPNGEGYRRLLDCVKGGLADLETAV